MRSHLGCAEEPYNRAYPVNINTLVNRPVLVENQETKRYLFSDGEPIKGNRGDEGGCIGRRKAAELDSLKATFDRLAHKYEQSPSPQLLQQMRLRGSDMTRRQMSLLQPTRSFRRRWSRQ